ncbi:chromosome segregation ATPase [Oxalobacteraceae bacterium GrIS 2.11]
MVTMMKLIKTALVFGLLSLTLAAQAADEKGAGASAKAQLRQAQQEKKKLEQEKGQLEQDKAALDTELKAVKDSVDAAKKSSASASKRNATLQEELDKVTAEKTTLTTKLADLQEQLDDRKTEIKLIVKQRKELETEKAAAESSLGQSLATCQAKNEEAYKSNVELLAKYEKKSCFSSLLQKEPFTGIKQTRVENEVSDFKDKLDKERLTPAKDVAAVVPAH